MSLSCVPQLTYLLTYLPTNLPTYLPYLPTYPLTNHPTNLSLVYSVLNEFKKAAATKVRRPSLFLSLIPNLLPHPPEAHYSTNRGPKGISGYWLVWPGTARLVRTAAQQCQAISTTDLMPMLCSYWRLLGVGVDWSDLRYWRD